jgi:hypothetical protein
MDIISGEQIQELCNVYLGYPEDFRYNPRIYRQSTKCLDIRTITGKWNNPRTIFVYGHRLPEFSKILENIQENFVLVSHNSDKNITDEYLSILNSPKLIRWHAQNIMIHHEKLHLLPIGLANSMWPHGNMVALKNTITNLPEKSKNVYFFFNCVTNRGERLPCKEEIEKAGLVFERPQANFEAYLKHLATFKYAICPPGNGIDSHRIWECLYLGVIPIVKRSLFTEKLKEKYPCVILLDSWSDFRQEDLIRAYENPGPMLYDTSEQIRSHCVSPLLTG